MRIYESVKEGEAERKVKYKEGTRETKTIKAGIHLLGIFLLLSFVCLITGRILFIRACFYLEQS